MVVPLAWLVRDGVPANEPRWWYGSESSDGPAAKKSSRRPAKKPRKSARATLASKRPPRKAARSGQGDLFDGGDRVAALYARRDDLGLPEAVVDALDPEQVAALVILHTNGRATADELARSLKRRRSLIPGFMNKLGRRLHVLRAVCFERNALPSGDAQYLWTHTNG